MNKDLLMRAFHTLWQVALSAFLVSVGSEVESIQDMTNVQEWQTMATVALAATMSAVKTAAAPMFKKLLKNFFGG